MLDAYGRNEVVRHAAYAPGEFPARLHQAAYDLHILAWPTPWEGRLDRDRFTAELAADHIDALFSAEGSDDADTLLAYVKWKATGAFYVSRDGLSEPSLASLPSASSAAYVCAYEITATPNPIWRGLGRRLLTETIRRWEQGYADAVFCTYSPKRGLTNAIRWLADHQQYGRPALEAFAHRAAAAAARHIDDWVDRLGQPLETFIHRQLVPVPDERMMGHLGELAEQYGREVIDGLVSALGIAYNFVFRARTGQPICGPAAFHRALGAEHWRQYAASATNCADALGLVDHWRYSHDPVRREKCARQFKEYTAARANPSADATDLIVLA